MLQPYILPSGSWHQQTVQLVALGSVLLGRSVYCPCGASSQLTQPYSRRKRSLVGSYLSTPIMTRLVVHDPSRLPSSRASPLVW